MSLPPEDSQAAACLAYLEELLRTELLQPAPCCERLSIALGAVEVALTARDAAKRAWPADLPATVDSLAQAFDGFVAELARSAALAAAPTPATKVKAVADAVWSRLNKGSYSKDLQHAQHVYNFAALLPPSGPPPGLKKQLDCAGVVTVTFATCQALALRHPAHADLAAARMQVSEDHCWIQLAGCSSREGSVEITTDTAAKRGLPVAADAWAGWLYTGGHAVLCSPRQALAALVTSSNPSISGGKKKVDSQELQEVQRRLLEVLLAEAPEALYSAALCALADLKEVEAQDQLETARDAGDAAVVARLLQRRPGDPLDLFEQAIALACCAGGGGSGGHGESGVQNGGGILENGDSKLTAAAHAAGGGHVAAEPAANREAAQLLGAPTNGAASALPAANGGSAAAAANGGGGSTSSGEGDPGLQWYVYSCVAAYLARRAEFLASCAAAQLLPAGVLLEQAEQQPKQEQPPQQAAEQQAAEQQQQQQQQEPELAPAQQGWWCQAATTYRQGLEAAGRGGGVLARYRVSPATDDQLFKDIEGVLEEVARDGLTAMSKHGGGTPLTDPALLVPLLRLWDGVCWLYSGRAKPSAWVALLLRLAKLFSPEAREAAAAAAEPWVSSGPMLAARPLWRDLKPVPLRPLLESADVGGGGGGERAAKRQRAG